MKFEVKLKEADFVALQLFLASKSKRIEGKRNKQWIIMIVFSLFPLIYFIVEEDKIMIVACTIITLASILFFRKYFDYRYKQYYENYVRENYQNKIDSPVSFELAEEFIFTKDKVGEGKIMYKEIKLITETANHLFVKISTGDHFVLPKNQIQNLDGVKMKFQEKGIVLQGGLSST